MSKTLSYITGFVLSVALTLMAPALLWMHASSQHQFPTHYGLYAGFTALAIAQLFVQLYFFLHVGREPKPRWNLIALIFALTVVAILVGGTLWIMNNLHHEQMTAEELFEDEAVTPYVQNL